MLSSEPKLLVLDLRQFFPCVVTSSISPLSLHQPTCCPFALDVWETNINYALHDEGPLVFVSDARNDARRSFSHSLKTSPVNRRDFVRRRFEQWVESFSRWGDLMS
eukprot:1582527-Pleurochrysis_carterae.AAC.3